jgi:hypothetical protein
MRAFSLFALAMAGITTAQYITTIYDTTPRTTTVYVLGLPTYGPPPSGTLTITSGYVVTETVWITATPSATYATGAVVPTSAVASASVVSSASGTISAGSSASGSAVTGTFGPAVSSYLSSVSSVLTASSAAITGSVTTQGGGVGGAAGGGGSESSSGGGTTMTSTVYASKFPLSSTLGGSKGDCAWVRVGTTADKRNSASDVLDECKRGWKCGWWCLGHLWRRRRDGDGRAAGDVYGSCAQ